MSPHPVAKKGKGPPSHKLPEQFPEGIILKDVQRAEWRLGEKIGQGGFGLIYLAAEKTVPSVTSATATHVIKIEPMGNGPLFCEMHFYMRAAKSHFIDAFRISKNLRYVGLPPYIGSGRHDYKSKEYRFLVMPRFGQDLEAVLQKSGGKLEAPVVLSVGLRMIDALHYIHEQKYVHADIKASNILLGYTGNSTLSSEVYLADFGLATLYVNGDQHKVYKEEPKYAHNGTLPFTSIDAHKGLAPSRRGDLEILGFCMIQWLSGGLPWDSTRDAKDVAKSKINSVKNVNALVKSCVPAARKNVADCIADYFKSVEQLRYEEEPDYNKLRGFLKKGLTACGVEDEWKIQFLPTTSKLGKRKSTDASDGIPDKKKAKGKSISPAKAKGKATSPARAKGKATSPARAKGKATSPARAKGKATSPAKAKGKVKATAKPLRRTSPKRKANPKEAQPELLVGSASPLKKGSEASPSSRKPKTPATDAETSKSGTKRLLVPKKVYQLPPPTKKSPTKRSPATRNGPARSKKVFQMPPPTKKSTK